MKKLLVCFVTFLSFVFVSFAEDSPEQLFDQGKKLYDSKQYSEAFPCFHKAADQGHADAQCFTGVCYEYGHGVKKDETEAVKWYRKAADQGYAKAQYFLGLNYEGGIGVEKNLQSAFSWYRKAAEQGYVKAQSKLGFCYGQGEGVKKDSAEAAKWFLKAAESGHVVAQFMIGLCYYVGDGVEKDIEQANIWLEKASKQKENAKVAQKAKEILESLDFQMQYLAFAQKKLQEELLGVPAKKKGDKKKDESAKKANPEKPKSNKTIEDVQKTAFIQVSQGLKAIKRMSENSIVGALTEDIKMELVKLVLFPTKVPGAYNGYYIVRRSGGMVPEHDEKVNIFVQSNGIEVEVTAIDSQRNEIKYSSDGFSMEGLHFDYVDD